MKKLRKKNTCDICGIVTYTADHHIISKCFGGLNDKSNITKVCSNCHNLIHYGDLVVEGWVITTRGRKLVYRNYDEESVLGGENNCYLY